MQRYRFFSVAMKTKEANIVQSQKRSINEWTNGTIIKKEKSYVPRKES